MNFAEPEVIIPLRRSYATKLVRELFRNAVKFTAQGAVTVDCGRIENGALTFSVTDTGCGIDLADGERIFECFYKEDTLSQGLGLD